MANVDSNVSDSDRGNLTRAEDSVNLSRAITQCANRGLSRVPFMQEVSTLLLDFVGCDALELRLSDRDLHYRWEATTNPDRTVRFERVRWTADQDGLVIPALDNASDLERLCRDVACRRFDASRPSFTSNGSFWTGDAWEPLPHNAEKRCVGGHYRSMVITRFFVDSVTIGLLHLKSEQPEFFNEEEVELYERVAQTLGLAVAGRRAEAALRERIKELTCMYGIAHVAAEPELPLNKALAEVVRLLPPAWQYPDNTAARLTLDGREFTTAGFRESEFRLSASIVAGGQTRGIVEVVYLEDRPELEAEVFLKEEEKLIEGVAKEVASLVERKEAADEKSRLQHQLIHADRLATIGQLAAGVAHELNEPLSSILGFAQLAGDCPGVPDQAAKDINKVVTASLYAREVIRKLMVFARQMPPQKARVDLNQVVDDALYFLEARCAKAGIDVVRDLAVAVPEVTADAAQCKQILVNLIVNALQAMPGGGTVTVRTCASYSAAELVVEDTGPGIDDEIIDKIFLPFFTTKDVSEGTGLGLAVVHGIVDSHGGTINVESRPGSGTRFVVRLPASRLEQTQEAPPDDE